MNKVAEATRRMRRYFLIIVTLACVVFQIILLYSIYLGQRAEHAQSIVSSKQTNFGQHDEPAVIARVSTTSSTTTSSTTRNGSGKKINLSPIAHKVNVKLPFPKEHKVFGQITCTCMLFWRQYVHEPCWT